MSEINWYAGNRGYVLRDYKSQPEFCTAPEFSGKRYERKEWVDLIDLQRNNKTSPKDVMQRVGYKAMSQKSTNYCWMYSAVQGVANRYIAQGVNGLDLNAFATAALGKKSANRGGYSTEAVRYIQKYGICEKSAWKEFDWTLSEYDKPEVKASFEKHKIVQFQELSKDNAFDSLMSALVCPFDPVPVAICLGWWRHAVLAVEPIYKGSRSNPTFGVNILNSWGPKWGQNGYGDLWGGKASPFEAVAITSVKVRKES